MGVFDKDLIQKDLSVKDILTEKIIHIASNIVNNINEASHCGIQEFSRMSEIGSYGGSDTDIVWPNRYSAFLDYITVNIGILQEQLNNHPILHDGKSILINSMRVFYDVLKYDNGTNTVPYKVVVDYTLRSGIIPFIRNERYRTEIDFDISLDPPRCEYQLPGMHFPHIW